MFNDLKTRIACKCLKNANWFFYHLPDHKKHPKLWMRYIEAGFAWTRTAILYSNQEQRQYLKKGIDELINFADHKFRETKLERALTRALSSYPS